MEFAEESAVKEIFDVARIPWSQLEGRTQRTEEGRVTKLRLSACLNLEELSHRIGELSSLEEIYIFWASRRLTHLPSESFHRLRNLRVLQLRWCQGIKELPLLGTSIEELVIEGCEEIVDLSCFQTGKRTWKRLRRLQIIQIGTRGVASLLEALSTKDEDDCRSSLFFPSLTFLSLRHNNIDQVGLAKLWRLFCLCPRLTKVDLRNNEIASLENLLPIAMTNRVSAVALRELNLAGNPVCSFDPLTPSVDFNYRHDTTQRESAITEGMIRVPKWQTVSERDTREMKRFDGQQKILLKIITANPQLVSILVCNGDCEQCINYRGTRKASCDCFQNSALFSPSVQHALDLNHCSKGKTLMGTTALTSYCKIRVEPPKSLSLSQWALVLERTNQIFDYPSPNIESANSLCKSLDSEECSEPPSELNSNDSNSKEQALCERKASVIYSLLQGPPLAARGHFVVKV